MAENEVFGSIGTVEPAVAPNATDYGAGKLNPDPLGTAVSSYYLTNPIARASEAMQECAQVYAPSHLLAAE